MFDTVIDYIARTNLFNFIIFAGIIIYVFIKLDVLGNLNKAAEVIGRPTYSLTGPSPSLIVSSILKYASLINPASG